jgi:hypothetical protein
MLSPRLILCVAALALLCGCQNVPKYKRSNGKFAEWSEYEGKSFSPSRGTVTAVDLKANAITIGSGKDSRVWPVTSTTRIINEGTDVPLSQLQVNQDVRYVTTPDRKELISVWYGKDLNVAHRTGGTKGKH